MKRFFSDIWEWIAVMVDPLDPIIKAELKYARQVASNLQDALLVEEDEAKRLQYELLLGRIEKMRQLAARMRWSVRRLQMSSRNNKQVRYCELVVTDSELVAAFYDESLELHKIWPMPGSRKTPLRGSGSS